MIRLSSVISDTCLRYWSTVDSGLLRNFFALPNPILVFRQGGSKKLRMYQDAACAQTDCRYEEHVRRTVLLFPGTSRLSSEVSTCHSSGRMGGVQLIRTPACHAGGRGFESRRSRQHYMTCAFPSSGSRSHDLPQLTLAMR